MLLKRIALTCIKVFLLVVVTAMVAFQIPELRYDFGTRSPVPIESAEELAPDRFGRSTFVAVRGKVDLEHAATFAMHGVRYTYFLLQEYGPRLVARTAEQVDESWENIELHLGRLRPYRRMPFSRSVRAGFKQQFDLSIPADAFFLGRDDTPRPSAWNVGAVIFAAVLWVILFYFFFLWRRRPSQSVKPA